MKRIMCSLLAVSILSNLQATALISTTYQNTYPIGQGINYTHIAGIDENGPQRANIIEYTPNENVSPFVSYGETIYGGSNILTASQYLEKLGNNVLAGINADFYTLSTGIPLGLVIKNGQLVSSDAWQNAIGFMADGSAIIDKPGMDMKLYFGDEYIQVNYFNKLRTNGYVYMFDSNFGTETKNSTSGTDIILEKIDNESILTPTSDLSFKVVDILKNSKSYPISENQFILSIDDKLSDRVPSVEIGEIVTLATRVSNTAWNNAVYAVGGQTILIKDGVIQPNLENALNPRSALGIKADGTIVTYEIDGRNSSFSNGISLTNLATEMFALGCIHAINLDGGGSSSVVVQLAGDNDVSVVNSPSGGSLRSNSNYIFFINNTAPTGNLSSLHIYPDNKLMLLNSTINVDVKGIDENFYPVAINQNQLNSTNIKNQSFTADTIGEITLSTSFNDITGQTTVQVLDTVGNISILNEQTNAILSTVNLNASEIIDLKATASYKYLPVTATDQSFTWETIGDIGEINELGILTATNQKSNGSIKISYGNFSKEFPVNIGYGKEDEVKIVDNFENDTKINGLNISQEYDTLKVANGKRSLSINYDYSNNDSSEIYFNSDILNFNILNVKVHGDGSDNELYANFHTKSGLTQVLVAKLNSSNFISYSIDMPDDVESFAGFSIKNGSTTTGTIYIDHVTLSTEKNDNVTPTINLSNVPQTASEITLTGTIFNDLRFSIKTENISVKINGVSKTFSYNENSGEFNFSSGALSQGINRLVISATDTFGNIQIRTFDILNLSNDTTQLTETFTDISNHWSKNYVNFANQNNYISDEMLDDALTFSPDRNITRLEFATIIARFLNLNISSTSTNFVDKNEIDSWALPYVVAVSNAGIMNGSPTADGGLSFNPQNTITRAEVMTVLGRIIEKGFARSSISFIDNENIPTWSYNHIETLISLGIINGYEDNSIRPLNNITRAEVCKLIYTMS